MEDFNDLIVEDTEVKERVYDFKLNEKIRTGNTTVNIDYYIYDEKRNAEFTVYGVEKEEVYQGIMDFINQRYDEYDKLQKEENNNVNEW